ncbi:hypothetical protein P8A21_40800 (plasmid) [Streptomyces poriferorum]|uniref:hypothetical protein n=1 Tax=Streptomyces poriferorum TaxID=2798799 RepID=UPI0027402428|nr:hypothetical protein [Streptomyces sp. Alt1]WLQ53859.1 hypothetical protein P8A21_40800 [Streptomyces sp. Alt1]
MKPTRLLATVALASSLTAGAALPAVAESAAPRTTAVAVTAETTAIPSAQASARKIAKNNGIKLLNHHVSGVKDARSTAKANIRDAARGKKAYTSRYAHPRGAQVTLNAKMLNAMQQLNAKRRFTFRVTAIAGSKHSPNSAHYKGRAFDVDIVNGSYVSTRGPGLTKAKRLMTACKSYGAKLVLGPGHSGHSTHVHCQW